MVARQKPPPIGPGVGSIGSIGEWIVNIGAGFSGPGPIGRPVRDLPAVGRRAPPRISVRPAVPATPRPSVPAVRVPRSTPRQPPTTASRPGSVPALPGIPGGLPPGYETRGPAPVVIDPETNPTGTVGETPARVPSPVLGVPWWLPSQGRTWQTPPTNEPGGPDVAIDWGDVLGGALGDIAGQLGAPGFSGPVAPVPSQVIVDTRTGAVKPCRRKRRRRLLTPTDLSDLAALKTITGNNDALKFAVMKAVRR